MKKTTVYPVQTDDYLINPGKGYVLYNQYEDGLPEPFAREGYDKEYRKCLEMCSCFVCKVKWSLIQPESADKFDWTFYDNLLALAEKYDKRVSFGVGLVVSTGGKSTENKVNSLVPQWVYDAGAAYNDIACPDFREGKPGVNRIPVWTDPIYRRYFERYIKAVAERYDGNPYIEFVGNFSHGNWGEWHHLDINNRPCCREMLYVDLNGNPVDFAFLKYYVDLFPRYFKKSRLILPTNVFEKGEELEEFCRYGIDTYAYGLKREGLISIPDCTYAMRYCAGKAPAVGEWQSEYTHYVADGRWTYELHDRSIDAGKLTHYNLGYYATDSLIFMRDEENLIRYWGNHMGYYLRMTECTFDEPDGGGDIGISVTFRNDGVAAPYLPVSLTAALMTKDGAVIDEQPFPADLSSVGEGEQKTFAATVRFAKDSRGVRLGIKAAAAGRPVLFGNAGLTASGYYCLSDCAQADVRVHFDGCGRGLRGLSGEHMGVNFGSELWKTVLQRDVYKVCAFRDVWFTESECRLTFPAGKTLISFTAFGHGTLTLKDCGGQTVSFELTAQPVTYRTGFRGETGSLKLSIESTRRVWSVKFIDFIYSDMT